MTQCVPEIDMLERRKEVAGSHGPVAAPRKSWKRALMLRDDQVTLQSTVDESSLAWLGEPKVASAWERVPPTRWNDPIALVPFTSSVRAAVADGDSECATRATGANGENDAAVPFVGVVSAAGTRLIAESPPGTASRPATSIPRHLRCRHSRPQHRQ